MDIGGCSIPNRLPSDAFFCTSAIFTSISFCLSGSARSFACLSHVNASEWRLPVMASSAFLSSFSIFSRFSRTSLDSFSTADLAALLCETACSACFSNASRLVRMPCTFCTGVPTACRKPASSSSGVPFRMSGTMRSPSFTPDRLGTTATVRLLFTRLMLILRSVPAVIIWLIA